MFLRETNSALLWESLFLVNIILLITSVYNWLSFYPRFSEYHVHFSFDLGILVSLFLVFLLLWILSWPNISNFSHCVFLSSCIQAIQSVSWMSWFRFSFVVNCCGDYSSHQHQDDFLGPPCGVLQPSIVFLPCLGCGNQQPLGILRV